MTERMQNSFVIKDSNQQVHWNADNLVGDAGLMSMGDGTSMEAGAFNNTPPMTDFTPAQLGINMSAYPGMNNDEGQYPTDMSAQNAAQIESSNNPFETPVQQDLVTGGVQFGAEGFINKTQSFIETNSYSLLIGGLLLFSGYYLRGVLKP